MKKLALPLVVLTIMMFACKKTDEQLITKKWHVDHFGNGSGETFQNFVGGDTTNWGQWDLVNTDCWKFKAKNGQESECGTYSLKNDTITFFWSTGERWFAVVKHLSKKELVFTTPENNIHAPMFGANITYWCSAVK